MKLSTSAALSALAALVACTAPDPVSIDTSADLAVSGGASTQAATIRITCERRGTRRSKISVDGNNLTPLNGTWSARVTSGANSAASPTKVAAGDEAEFDFDSARNDIAAGATPISRTFITINPSGPDVMAQIVDAAGNVAASGSAECRSR